MTPVTGMFAALLGLLFVGLSVRAILIRRRSRIAIGDGDNQDLLRAIRVHGNFAEYAPFGLLLVALAELNGAAYFVVLGLNILLFAGRCCHAYGVSQSQENYRYRVTGMSLSFTSIAGSAITLIVLFVSS